MPAKCANSQPSTGVLSRKLCRSPHHKGPRWIWIGNFTVLKWTDESKVIPFKLESHCRSCVATRRRERTGHKLKSTVELVGKVRSGPKGYEPQTRVEHEIFKEYRRKKYEAESLDQKEKRREYQRIRSEAIRRDEGVPQRKKVTRSGQQIRSEGMQHDEPLLDAGPLVVWLTEMTHRHGLTATASGAGIGTDRLNSLLDGAEAVVSLDIADRIVTGLGYPEQLTMLYPIEEE